MPPLTPSTIGGGSLNDMLTSVQALAQNCQKIATALQQSIPSETSGQLSADTLVQTGFVRLLGISVVAAGAVGALHDARTLALAASGNQVAVVQATAGYFAVDMIFADGLVYKPGSGQTCTLFYARI